MNLTVIRRFAVVVLFCAFVLPTAYAATFTVTNGADSGPGTLRQAILDANATPGRDQIVFAVSHVIVYTLLPVITGPVDIDGTASSSRAKVASLGTCEACAMFRFGMGSSGSTIRDLFLTEAFHYPIRVNSDVSGVTIANIIFNGRLQIEGSNNLLGGTAAADRLHASNIGYVAFSAGSGNQLIGSRVGEVLVYAPNTSIRNNTITGISSGTPGVFVLGNVTGVEITGNSITSDGAAIELGFDGPTPNDPAPDADLGPNGLQNFPVLTSAYLTPGALTVSGTLVSAPLTPYQIELFSNAAANPDARTFLGAFNVTTDATGNATFTQTITSNLPAAGEVITSTATNRGTVATPGNFPNSTSEVSPAVAVTQPGMLALSATTYSVDEGGGTVTITVQRTGGSEGTVTVNYATTNGTATAPGDYTATSGTLTFGSGVTQQTFHIPIVDDTMREAAETFTIALSGATGGATLGTATATVTITDNEPAEAVPTASEWALITMALALALIGIMRR
jgi:hypothetical protein